MKDKILKIFYLLIALLALIPSCFYSAGTPVYECTSETVGAAHVRVWNTKVYPDGKVGSGFVGGGIVIGHKDGRTYVLTAKHTIEVDEPEEDITYKLQVWTQGATKGINARLEEESNHGLDAVIISTKSFDHRVAKISETNPAKGQRVFVLGSPSKSFRAVYERRVDRFEGRIRGRLRYQLKRFILDEFIIPGFSGGGVYSTYDELVGMCIAVHTEDHNKGICIPIETLRELIDPYTS